MAKKVVFHRIQVEGFRSYQAPTNFPLDNKGVNLIKGENGAGKTSIFSALSWVLYKVNLNATLNDKVQTWDWQRLPAYRGTRVAAEFSVGNYDYMVVRHLKFKGTTRGLKGGDSLMIFKRHVDDNEDGKFEEKHLVGEAQHKGDQQEYINHLLGFDSRTFLNSVLFGQRMNRLVSADNEEKRKLFENLFNMDFIDAGKEAAKEKKTELELQVTKLSATVDNGGRLVVQLKERITEQEAIVARFEKDKKAKVKEAKERLDYAKNELNTAEKELKVLLALLPKGDASKDVASKYQDLEIGLDKLELEQEKLKTEQRVWNGLSQELYSCEAKGKKLANDLKCVKENCPTCKAPLNKAEVAAAKKELQKQIDTELEVYKVLEKKEKQSALAKTALEENVADIKELVDIARGVHDVAKKAMEGETKNRTAYAVKQQAIKSLKDKIVTYEESLERESKAKPPTVDLAGVRKQLAEKELEVKAATAELEKVKVTLERVLWWFTKGFGAGGLKAFVFSAMLNQLNHSVMKYAARLGFGVKFSVDLTKSAKPFITKCYRGENELDYNDLSGGQKQRIDVCLAFAMHDVVSAVSDFNILIMDEIFEGLDAEGIETVFDLIRIKAGEGRSVYVVTHSAVIDSLTAKTINIELDENECSYIK